MLKSDFAKKDKSSDKPKIVEEIVGSCKGLFQSESDGTPRPDTNEDKKAMRGDKAVWARRVRIPKDKLQMAKEKEEKEPYVSCRGLFYTDRSALKL